jgi:hypothetical protein
MKTLVMNRLSRLMSKYFELYYIFCDRVRPKVSFVIKSDSENYLYDHDSIDYSQFMIPKSNFEC